VGRTVQVSGEVIRRGKWLILQPEISSRRADRGGVTGFGARAPPFVAIGSLDAAGGNHPLA